MKTDEQKREEDRLRKAFEVLDTLITRAEILALSEADLKKAKEDEE